MGALTTDSLQVRQGALQGEGAESATVHASDRTELAIVRTTPGSFHHVHGLVEEEKTLAQLSSEYGVSTKQLSRWKNHVLTEMPRLFESKNEQNQQKYEGKINELYAEIGRLTTQVNWLKKKSGLNLEPD